MILPLDRDRSVVVFHVWPALAYGTRLTGSFVLMAAGLAVQVVTEHVLPGVVLLALGNLFLLVRGYDNRVDFQTYDPATERERVEPGRLNDLKELHREIRRWDTSALDVSNRLGIVLFTLIGVAMTAGVVFVHGPLQILVIDAMVLLLPHWLTGIRSILVLPKMMVRVNTIHDLLHSAESLADHEVHLLMLLRGGGTKIPDDVKFKVDIKGHHTDFLGLYGQVVLNEVQGKSYPYFYVVLVGRLGYGLEAASRAYSAPPGIVCELKLQDEVEVMVIRQQTTKTSGYHTEITDAQQILSEGLRVAEKVAVRALA